MSKIKLIFIVFAFNIAFAQEGKIAELDYSLKNEQAKDAAKAVGNSSENLSWRDWTKILTYTAAAICGTVAIIKYSEAQNDKNRFDSKYMEMPATNQNGEYNVWYYNNYNPLKDSANDFNDNKNSKNIFGVSAGIFAIAGTLTFFF